MSGIKQVIAFSFLLLISSFRLCAQKKVSESDLQSLSQMMSGSFSSEAQSLSDSDFFDIRLHMKRIWPERKGQYWLYIEQAMAAKPEQPYRQRIYHLSVRNDSTIVSEVYNFKGNALKYAGEWKKTNPLEGLVLDSLEAREGCIIYLHKTGENTFEGSTRANDCTSNLRGASYATSQAVIKMTGMVSWDRGYDKDGKQVWGAKKGGYDFRKLESY